MDNANGFRNKYTLDSDFFSVNSNSYNHGQKSWDTLAFLGDFSIHTDPTPPLTPQTTLDACIHNFSGFNFVQGGRRDNCKKISKRMHCFMREPGNYTKLWILRYCFWTTVREWFGRLERKNDSLPPNSYLKDPGCFVLVILQFLLSSF